MDKEGSGTKYMIDNNEYEDLVLLYTLMTRANQDQNILKELNSFVPQCASIRTRHKTKDSLSYSPGYVVLTANTLTTSRNLHQNAGKPRTRLRQRLGV